MEFSKESSFRICVALGAPSPLAAFLVIITQSTSDSLTEKLLGFPFFVFTAYAYGILPSMLYSFLMEVWFGMRLHLRFGRLATILFSALLGAGAGFLIQTVIIQEIKYGYFIPIGGIVGLIVGFFLFRYSANQSGRQ
jgi:hypothetical protein